MSEALNAREALALVPGLDAETARIDELTGGLSNRVYRVRSRDLDWVLRIAPPVPVTPGVNRRRELDILRSAAKAGIAPAIVYSSSDAGILVTEFLDGRVWQATDLESPKNIETLAELIRKVHALPPCGSTLDLAELAESYERFLESRHGLHAFAASCVRIVRDSPKPDNVVCCHNDIVASNVIDAGGLKLVDWEYACDNDPLFDFASLAGFHGLDKKRRRQLLDAYTGGTGAALAERLDERIRIFDAIHWLWLAVRQLQAPQSAQIGRLEELRQRIG